MWHMLAPVFTNYKGIPICHQPSRLSMENCKYMNINQRSRVRQTDLDSLERVFARNRFFLLNSLSKRFDIICITILVNYSNYFENKG